MFRRDPAFAAEYLNHILEEGDQTDLMLALRHIADAFGGISQLAKEAELNPTALYRTLSPKGQSRTQDAHGVAQGSGHAPCRRAGKAPPQSGVNGSELCRLSLSPCTTRLIRGDSARALHEAARDYRQRCRRCALKVTRKHLSAILNGRASVTPDMALRLAAAFRTDAEIWLNLQSQHDLWQVRGRKGKPAIRALVPRKAA